MAGMTLETAQARLDMWLAAEEAVATRGQNYSIGGRSLSRADLGDIRSSIDYWQKKVDQLAASAVNGGRGRVRYAVPE